MAEDNNLNGLDKTAILFQIFGESLAITMFQELPEAHLLRIRVRAKELKNVPTSIKQGILEEFYFKMMSQKHHNLSSGDQLFKFLIELNEEQIFSLINTEPPKVIALALDQLYETKKIKILNRFDTKIKHDVIMELGNLHNIPLEGVVTVAQELKQKASFIPGPKEFSRGGGKSIATILSQMNPDEANQYLDQISGENPELFNEIKKHFLSFDDLLSMPNHLMSTFWRNPDIDVDELSKAFKGEDEATVKTILEFLPKRKQAMYAPLDKPISKKDVDKAKLSFVQLAKKLAKKGEFNLEDLLSDEEDMID